MQFKFLLLIHVGPYVISVTKIQLDFSVHIFRMAFCILSVIIIYRKSQLLDKVFRRCCGLKYPSTLSVVKNNKKVQHNNTNTNLTNDLILQGLFLK